MQPVDRYGRQTSLPEIGPAGQERLRKARALIVGVGGLGSPIALYLAAAGVGTLGLVDDDSVSVSNLQRQVLYAEAEVGLPKVYCAARRLQALNSGLRVETHPYRLTEANAGEVIARYDLVVDGCDNYATRYLMSDTCLRLGKPYVYGAIRGLEGQAAVLCTSAQGKTYRHLYPEEGEMRELHTDKSAVGVTAGIVGMVQAGEALKLICGYGEVLRDRLWTIDLRTLQSYILTL